MTPDCPFCNPLQSRVTSVRSYYLTSYGYLRFYWIRLAASPLTRSAHRLDHPFQPFLQLYSSYVRHIGRSCTFAVLWFRRSALS